MSNTKIVVLRSKEVITAAIFVGIAVIVLFVLLLGFLFTGKNDSKTTAQSNGDQKYEAGVYTKELTIRRQRSESPVIIGRRPG